MWGWREGWAGERHTHTHRVTYHQLEGQTTTQGRRCFELSKAREGCGGKRGHALLDREKRKTNTCHNSTPHFDSRWRGPTSHCLHPRAEPPVVLQGVQGGDGHHCSGVLAATNNRSRGHGGCATGRAGASGWLRRALHRLGSPPSLAGRGRLPIVPRLGQWRSPQGLPVRPVPRDVHQRGLVVANGPLETTNTTGRGPGGPAACIRGGGLALGALWGQGLTPDGPQAHLRVPEGGPGLHGGGAEATGRGGGSRGGWWCCLGPGGGDG